jgi:2-dehydro-3-deoxyglucarate aldolase
MTLKDNLKAGRSVIGTWVASGSPVVLDIMSSFPWDFIVLDAEHGPIDAPIAHALMRDCRPLVRVEDGGNYWTIKKYLDMGAGGVIVPRVESGYAMKAIKDAAFYFPQGRRGLGYSPSNGYGRGIKQAVRQNDGVVVIPQIESNAGILNLPLILEQGPDAAMIGPWDLSADMGRPGEFEDRHYLKTLDYFLRECQRTKVPPGIHIPDFDPDKLLEAKKAGFRFLVFALDVSMLTWACEQGIKRLLEK